MRTIRQILIIGLLSVYSVNLHAKSRVGTITHDLWTGISGGAVSNLTASPNYPDSPTSTSEINIFELVSVGENFGSRIHGYIHPPTSGNYVFWIAGDDGAELWLSSNNDSSNISLIAAYTGYTNPREWTKFTSQTSDSINLQAGQKYYIRVLHKESGGADHIAVAWQGPTLTQQVIGGTFLSPWAGVAPNITEQPADVSVDEGASAEFSVSATGTALQFQWQKDGQDIAGASDSVYTIPSTQLSDSGSEYRCIIYNDEDTVTSNIAELSVAFVHIPPQVTTQPSDLNLIEGDAAVFIISASGTLLTYQWQRNEENIMNAINSSYSLPITTLADSGAEFRCIVSNNLGIDTSNAAILSLKENLSEPPMLVAPPRDTTIPDKEVIFFWLSVEDAESYRLQISKDSIFDEILEDIPDLPTAQTSVTLETEGTYYWRVAPVNFRGQGVFSSTSKFTIGTLVNIFEDKISIPHGLGFIGQGPQGDASSFILTVPHASKIKLTVYSPAKGTAYTLINRSLETGKHRISYPENVPITPGIYIYQLSMDKKSIRGRFVKL